MLTVIDTCWLASGEPSAIIMAANDVPIVLPYDGSVTSQLLSHDDDEAEEVTVICTAAAAVNAPIIEHDETTPTTVASDTATRRRRRRAECHHLATIILASGSHGSLVGEQVYAIPGVECLSR